MNFELFIARRITFKSKRTISKTIVRFAISAVALSVAVMLITVAVLNGFQTEIKNKVIGFSSHIQISQINFNYTYENPGIIYDSDVVSVLKTLPEVRSVNSFATKAGIVKAKSEIEGIVLKAVDKSFDWTGVKSVLKAGKLPDFSGKEKSNDVLISEFLADRLDLEVGSFLEVHFVESPPRVRKLNICGIFNTGLEEIDNTFALCDIRQVQQLNGWDQNVVGGYEIRLNDIDQLDEANDKIRVLVPIDQDSRTIKEIFPQLFDWLGLLDTNVRVILILMLIVGAVNMITALLIIILEKTHLIGLIKAFGAQNRSVAGIFIFNSMVLVVSGIVIGDILGLLVLLAQHYFEIIKLPVEYYFIDRVPVLFPWGVFAALNAGTLIICLVFMILPAMYISKIQPLKAIRFE